MSGLAFLSPWRLLLLFVVVALAVVYVVFQRRRSSYAVRFTNLDLLESVAPKRPGWRRHLTAAVQLLALGACSCSPSPSPPTRSRCRVSGPRSCMAIDTSLSMEATDVKPDRISAAKAAATSFLDDVPAEVNVGPGQLLRHRPRSRSPPPPTARPWPTPSPTSSSARAPPSARPSTPASTPSAPCRPAPDGSVVPAAIVVMSDGTTTMGVANEDAAARAKEEAVPVSTIAFGTENGTVVIGDTGEVVQVPVDAKSLAAIATETGGQSYEAATQGQLADVYASIGSSIGYDTVDSDITEWFVAAAMLGFVLSAGFALAWSNRIP